MSNFSSEKKTQLEELFIPKNCEQTVPPCWLISITKSGSFFYSCTFLCTSLELEQDRERKQCCGLSAECPCPLWTPVLGHMVMPLMQVVESIRRQSFS